MTNSFFSFCWRRESIHCVFHTTFSKWHEKRKKIKSIRCYDGTVRGSCCGHGEYQVIKIARFMIRYLDNIDARKQSVNAKHFCCAFLYLLSFRVSVVCSATNVVHVSVWRTPISLWLKKIARRMTKRENVCVRVYLYQVFAIVSILLLIYYRVSDKANFVFQLYWNWVNVDHTGHWHHTTSYRNSFKRPKDKEWNANHQSQANRKR